MSSLSTFGTFTMARLGIYVSQQALNVTGNNISNINTDGYSRQELDQKAMYYGAGDRFITKYSVRENGGVLATGVNQLRDQYLDIRYRNEMTKVGEMETKINGLDQVAEVFDEVAKGEDGEGVLEARFNDLIQQLENLSQPQNVGQDGADALVREAAEAITVQFNDYAKKLATLDENLRAEFRDNVDSVNATLEKIRDLNTSIRKSEIFGTDALVQRDERNLLIDKLSEQIGIHVTYEMEQVGNGVEVERMIIKTAGDPGEKEYTLIDGVYGAQISINDAQTLGINISPLTSVRGIEDPREPNALIAKEIQGAMPKDDATAGTVFKNAETAQSVVDLLNADEDYSNGENGKTYRFGVVATGGRYTIHRYDITDQLEGDPTLAEATSEQLAGNEGLASVQMLVDATLVSQTGDTELSGGLQAMRELLTEEGEYASAEDLAIDPNAGVKRGLPYYRQALDTLAREFAKKMNEANTMDDATIYEAASERVGYKNASGTIYTESELPDGANLSDYTKVFITADKEETTDPNEYTIFKTDSEGKKVLKEEYSYYNGGVLFSNNGRTDTTGDSGDEDSDPPITAANISVAYSWSHGMTRVLRSKEPDAQERSTEQSNIDHFISMLFAPHRFEFGTATEGTTYFKGTFQDMLTDSIAGTLAKDQNITKSMLSNYTATAEEINLDRDSVMGVDLNDEAMNMMMFQKAYSAACRLMTTYDGMLEKLINGTAV